MEVFKAALNFLLVLLSLVEIASSICCEDIRLDVEQKELAHTTLCSAVSSDLAQCCRDLGMNIEKQRQAYETLCPTAMKPFHANFTNLGATGRFGPTSLGSHYVGKDHENMVSVMNGTQFWTVPYTGTYRITAVGAAGGYDTSGSSARGRGAYMRGEFSLNKGDIVKILVGQEGPINTFYVTAGGGGGSFVATSSNSPLIVAGGGGGIERLYTRLANCDASTRTSGRQNQCQNSCAIWSGGVNGSGALEADRSNSGGGGGGFYSNGRSSMRFGGAYGYGGEGGKGFVQGGAGGRARVNNAEGGFGGGGGAYGNGGGAGGGGGYSGGASGNNNYDSCGGGAGSYNEGNNQVNMEGYHASGHGYVEIKLLA